MREGTEGGKQRVTEVTGGAQDTVGEVAGRLMQAVRLKQDEVPQVQDRVVAAQVEVVLQVAAVDAASMMVRHSAQMAKRIDRLRGIQLKIDRQRQMQQGGEVEEELRELEAMLQTEKVELGRMLRQYGDREREGEMVGD